MVKNLQTQAKSGTTDFKLEIKKLVWFYVNTVGSHNVCIHWMYLYIENNGMKTGLVKSKHLAKIMYYWLYTDVVLRLN